jgi:RPA family protein
MIKRQPAYIVSIKDIITGTFVKTEGWDPNYVTLSWGLKVSRVNVLGSVVDKSDQEISLDDSTGVIKVRSFEPFPDFEQVSVGDVVLLIGKVGEYGEIYLRPEICRKVEQKWISQRKDEWEIIKKIYESGKIIQTEAEQVATFSPAEEITEDAPVENMLDKIISFINANDTGTGVPKDVILRKFPEGKEVLNTLIMEGDIFEIKPDVFKVLT